MISVDKEVKDFCKFYHITLRQCVKLGFVTVIWEDDLKSISSIQF